MGTDLLFFRELGTAIMSIRIEIHTARKWSYLLEKRKSVVWRII